MWPEQGWLKAHLVVCAPGKRLTVCGLKANLTQSYIVSLKGIMYRVLAASWTRGHCIEPTHLSSSLLSFLAMGSWVLRQCLVQPSASPRPPARVLSAGLFATSALQRPGCSPLTSGQHSKQNWKWQETCGAGGHLFLLLQEEGWRSFLAGLFRWCRCGPPSHGPPPHKNSEADWGSHGTGAPAVPHTTAIFWPLRFSLLSPVRQKSRFIKSHSNCSHGCTKF